MEVIDKMVKKNGFARPFHIQQIITWLIFAFDTYAYYFMNIVTLSHIVPLAAVLGVVYGIIITFVFYYGVLSTKSDPTDPTIYAERKARKQGYNNQKFFNWCI